MKPETLYAHTPSRYPIIIGSGLLGALPDVLNFSSYSSAVILSDKTVAPLWLGTVRAAVGDLGCFEIEPGENSKSIATATQVWNWMLEAGCDRTSLLIALGGGVVLDLAGFVASNYMRGVPFVFLPTSLLAQADSSLGGKTAVNLAGTKNSIGSFAVPQAVLIDIDTLQTLPDRQFAAGLAEIIKHGAIADRDLFALLMEMPPGPQSIGDILQRSCELKLAIVEKDFYETGERRLLNFGHTLGHALEAWSAAESFSLLHGEAVALGMIAESYISKLLGYLDHDSVIALERCLEVNRLPTRLRGKTPEHETLHALIARDKKKQSGTVRWTLLESIGRGRHGINVPKEITNQAIDYLCSTSSPA